MTAALWTVTAVVVATWLIYHGVSEILFYWQFRDCHGPPPVTGIPPLREGAIVVPGEIEQS